MKLDYATNSGFALLLFISPRWVQSLRPGTTVFSALSLHPYCLSFLRAGPLCTPPLSSAPRVEGLPASPLCWPLAAALTCLPLQTQLLSSPTGRGLPFIPFMNERKTFRLDVVRGKALLKVLSGAVSVKMNAGLMCKRFIP